jgi:hypothetical protein
LMTTNSRQAGTNRSSSRVAACALRRAQVAGSCGSEGLDHTWHTVRIFSTAAGVKAHATAVLDSLKSEPIPFGFVDPVVARRRGDMG